MSGCPQVVLADELVRLGRTAKRVGKTGSCPARASNVIVHCETLCKLVPALLLPYGDDANERGRAAVELLEAVAFSDGASTELLAMGDLLGLTKFNGDKVDDDVVIQWHEDYKRKYPRRPGKRGDVPRYFARYTKGILLMIAARRFDLSASAIKERESGWAEAFAAELCGLLKDQDGALTNLAHNLGYLLTDGVDTVIEARDVQSNVGLVVGAVPENTQESHGYIHRPLVEAQFNRLVDDGAKLIAFIGQPGMGKTTLARSLAPGAAFIEFWAGKPNHAYLRPELEKYRIPTGDLTEDNAEGKLMQLMISDPGPRVIVLDNLQSTNELRHLVPSRTAATIMATCRQSGELAPDWCHEVSVDIMSHDEALEMAGSLLPSLSEEDARLLVTSSCCYPLVIDALCGHMKGRHGVDLNKLCRSIEVNPGPIKTRAGEQLRILHAQTVAELRERCPLAVDFLAYASSSSFAVGLDTSCSFGGKSVTE